MNLANKYRPSDFDSVIGQGVVVNIVKKMCTSGQLSNRNFLFTAPAGTGKAQPLYSKVLTPKGFITMGDVQIGTEVITGSGAVAKVSGVYPQGVRPIYEITLQDRTKIRVSDEHLNVVYRYNQDRKCREDYCLTTKELISFHKDSRFKLRIDTPSIQTFGGDSAIDQLPIDPYLLGAFIGDGSISDSTAIKFSNGESDVIDKVDRILRRDWNTCLHRISNTAVDYRIATVGYSTYKYIFIFDGNQYFGVDALQRQLVDLGYPCFDGDTLLRICDNTASNTLNKYPELIGRITYSIDNMFKFNGECTKFAEMLSSLDLRKKSVDKHIPKQYLLSSVDNRLALLQGLFDTDGYIAKGGAVEYATSSKQLSEDFAFLVRSLGIRDTIVQKLPKYTYDGELRTGHVAYRHSLKIPNGLQFYTSKKHASHYTDRQQPPLRNIVSIQYIGDEACQCIYVDHPDHTYISDDFIPTHNTTLSRIIAKSLNGNTDNIIEVDAASHSGVDDVRELIQQASQFPIGTKYKIIVMDECFPENTWVTTPSGKVQIKDLRVGDRVCNLQGQTTITHIFENRVTTSNLISIIVDGKQIITTKNHLFFTDDGWVEACNLHKGDQVYDYSLLQTMRKTISSESSQQQKDPMQFGMPQNLATQQDVWQTYQRISKNMSDMWQRLLHSEECKCNNLLRGLWLYLEKTESKYGAIIGATFKALAYIYLSRLWDSKGDQEQSISEVLQYQVCRDLGTAAPQTEETCNQGVRMVQEFIYRELFGSESENLFPCMSDGLDCLQAEREKISEIFRTNETEESDVRSEYCSQDACNKGEERDFTSRVCLAWWKRTIYSPSDYAVSGARGRVDIRIRSVNSHIEAEQSESLSYELQTRPCLRGQIVGDRGGWCEPQIEISTVARCQESRVVARSRVDSVEVYQRGNNDELFWSSFSDKDLSQEYVTMYDIEVEGHPSYFVDDILVHNCHALSQAAWQALLKCLEEQVGNTVWIFCTTNPEKIPATIISRVQTFKLSKISTENIQKQLKFILDSEIAEGRQLTYTEDALSYIARLSNGGMRDAITSLDKVLAFGSDVNSELIEKALDLPDYNDYFNLLNHLVRKDNAGITEMIDRVYNSGTNFVRWFEGFHSFLCNIVKYVLLKDISRTMIPSSYQDKLSKYGSQHAFICLKLANVVMTMNKELKTTQYLQETAMTFLCVPASPKKGETA